MTTVDARFRDVGLPIADRTEILLGQMTVAEKAGLLFQTMILPAEPDVPESPSSASAPPRDTAGKRVQAAARAR